MNENLVDETFEIFEKFKPITLESLLTREFEAPEWLITDLLPAEAIIALSGESTVGKTWIEILIAQSIASDGTFLDHFNVETPGKVLIINEEDSAQALQSRCKSLGLSKVYEDVLFTIRNGFSINIDSHFEWLKTYVETQKLKLICLDTFRDIFSGDENNSEEINKTIKRLREINNLGCSVLIVHHHRKDGIWSNSNPTQTLRGSSALFASLDVHIFLKKLKDNKIQVKQPKCRVGTTIPSFVIEMVREENTVRFKYAGEAEEDLQRLELAGLKILELLEEKPEMATPEIIQNLQGICGKNIVSDALKHLVETEDISKYKKQGEGKTDFYSLQKTENYLM